MNWFIYIGGGIIFEMIGISFLVLFIDSKIFKKENPNIGERIVMYSIFSAPLLIWIWICGRFIK